MIITLSLYLSLVYLIFFKWKLLPFNKITGGIVVVLGVMILNIFLVGLQTLTPQSAQGMITGSVTEIAPQVSGRVIEVPVKPFQRVEPGDTLFKIDPRPYQYRVDQLTAQLVETEAYVAQLKESYDAARAQTNATQTQLALSELRLRQYQELLRTGAGSSFDVERYETEVASGQEQLAAARAQENQALLNLRAQVGDTQSRVAQVLAQIESAQFDLENCTVQTPAEGLVSMNTLRPGMQVSPMRSVMAFVYTDTVAIGGLFAQKALENIAIGNKAQISFPTLPGRLFQLKLQVTLARETVDIMNELTRLVEQKQEVGQVSMQDVYLSRADRDAAEEALRQAVGGQKQAQRALEILLGRYPSAEVETADELIPVPPPIPVGVPADIVGRRPDLTAAERRVAAAFYLTEEARLARYPSFSLTASLGGSSDLGDVIGELGAGIVAPLFTGGALEAQLDSATADQEAAIAAFGQSVLRAFEEVETSLTNERLYEEREQFLESVVENNERAYEMARDRYDVGQTDLLSVLQIQAKWIGARVGLVRIKNERLAQRVNLHLALGGSFERQDNP